MTNFLPVGKTVFVYQALEYDLVPPAGQGSASGLTYFFVNARWTPTRIVDVQGTYHRGRSVDSRTITDDVRNGRPIDAKQLDGFLYESYGGRVTVEVIPRLRLWGGYTLDRDNRDDKAYGRVGFGMWASNVLGTGVDVTASDYRNQRSNGSYDSWYFSLGRSIGPKVYLSLDYSTSLSVLSYVGPDGIVLQNKPKTRRFGLSGNANLSRHFSLMLTAELLDDDTSRDVRVLTGVTYRF